MLLQLNIINFALIEKLSVSFESGFNVLSGETGAGKSILIDAINYVLGSKFNKDLIRTGEDKTFVEAIFALENDKTIELLKQYDIEHDDLIIISRETFQSGKSIAKVNGKSMLISNIRAISQTLLDIHGQHENQSLLDSSNHINYLDYYAEAEIKGLMNEYRNNFYRYNEIKSKINEIKGRDGEREKLIDFFQYQINELNAAKLKIDEDIELENRFNMLSNSEKINKTLSSSYEKLYNGTEDSASIFDELGTVLRELKSIEKHMEKVKEISKNLETVYYNLEESIEAIRALKENINYDENELEYINNRMYQINSYKKKYGKTIKDILEYKEKIEKQFEEYTNSSEIIEKLEKEKEKIYNIILSQAKQIHELRNKSARELEQRVKNELNYIGLEKSIFKIEVKLEDNLNEDGADKVQFFISTNPGEPLKPLDRIVSGGELSRIMLALKTVFVDQDKIPSVIFDEIDVGISGRIANSVAEKMYSISSKHQVFCVTHLPQIACMSDAHYLVEKSVVDDKTFTSITRMNEADKEFEVARMIGTSEVTKLTIEHAKELISMAEKTKKIYKKM